MVLFCDGHSMDIQPKGIALTILGLGRFATVFGQ